jgi:cytochrome b involved in lipid metabolism
MCVERPLFFTGFRYVPDHPGDVKIAAKAGQDNSIGFHGDQHGESVFALVEEYRIGNLKK